MQMPIRQYGRLITKWTLQLLHQRWSLFLHLWNWPCDCLLPIGCDDVFQFWVQVSKGLLSLLLSLLHLRICHGNMPGWPAGEWDAMQSGVGSVIPDWQPRHLRSSAKINQPSPLANPQPTIWREKKEKKSTTVSQSPVQTSGTTQLTCGLWANKTACYCVYWGFVGCCTALLWQLITDTDFQVQMSSRQLDIWT